MQTIEVGAHADGTVIEIEIDVYAEIRQMMGWSK